jgi:predicted  nucleic acid-binding Zn-ribbon protein
MDYKEKTKFEQATNLIDWAKYRIEKLEKENGELTNRVNELKDKIDDLNDVIKDLRDELESQMTGKQR